MRPPTFTYKNFQIRYRQEPYKDRFFHVLLKSHPETLVPYREMYRFSQLHWRAYGAQMFWFVEEQDRKKLDAFLQKCDDYDTWMNETD